MHVRRVFLPILAMFALTLTFVVPVGTTAVASGQRATLKVTVRGGYSSYYGGQGVLLTGRLPVRGVRTVWVEHHMNRPGDRWVQADPPLYRGKTKPNGSFRLAIQAPDMFGISYRVRGGKYVTPKYLFNAKSEEVGLTASTLYPTLGLEFGLTADTTPDLYHREDTRGGPVLKGRKLTLQEQTSDSGWRTRATSTVTGSGAHTFALRADEVGEHVYRVRAERWTKNGSFVGWHSSFPLAVSVLNLDEVPPDEPGGNATPPPRPPGGVKGATTTAQSRYGWSHALWDFAWERGEDLDSPPKRGTRLRGRWVQATTGLGRVSKHNGGIRLDSGINTKGGRGDRGSVYATLKGNSLTYGRWETRLRERVGEGGGSPYALRAELVPSGRKKCGPSIVMGEYSGVDNTLRFGATKGRKSWARSIKTNSPLNNSPALAVEVGKDHVTWFLDGKAIGVVKTRAAVPGVPLTMRFSLVGSSREGQNTSLFSDWQRAFPLSYGKQAKRGPKLKRVAAPRCG